MGVLSDVFMGLCILVFAPLAVVTAITNVPLALVFLGIITFSFILHLKFTYVVHGFVVFATVLIQLAVLGLIIWIGVQH